MLGYADIGYVRRYFLPLFCFTVFEIDWPARDNIPLPFLRLAQSKGAFWKVCCFLQSLPPDNVLSSFNSFNVKVLIIQKSVNWFVEQTNCLVVIWWQPWRYCVKLPKIVLNLHFDVNDLAISSSNFGPNSIFSLSLNASAFSFSIILTFSLSLINDIKILNLLIYTQALTAWPRNKTTWSIKYCN